MNMSVSGSGSWFNTSQLASSLFSKLDTKQQGYIDQGELESALSAAPSSPNSTSTSSADALFKQLDTNGDGKITQSELSSGLQNLADALQAQLQQSRIGNASATSSHRPHHSHADKGLSKDQLTAIANNPNTDSTRASLFSNLAANFTAADTNGDGKISRSEAISFDQAHPSNSTTTATTSSPASASSTDSSNTAGSAPNDNSLQFMLQLMQLLHAYGVSSSNATAANSPTISTSA